jgi:hypothetical protein
MTLFPNTGAITSTPSSRQRGRGRTGTPGAAAFAVAIAAALLVAAAPAGATMYKWVDKNGKVVYSDQPPPADVKSEIVKPPPPPVNPNAARELADKELEVRQRDKKRADDAQAAEKTRVEAERRRENCANARGQLLALQNANVVRYNEKGERIVLDEAGRREAAERLQQAVLENCK